jgi:tellurite resistance protein TerC
VVTRIKRLIKVVVGFTVLAAGIAMLVLPGPGWVVIAVALAILAGEYVWAQRLLKRLKDAGQTINDNFNPMKRRPDQP